jgi:hypothetical protein
MQLELASALPRQPVQTTLDSFVRFQFGSIRSNASQQQLGRPALVSRQLDLIQCDGLKRLKQKATPPRAPRAPRIGGRPRFERSLAQATACVWPDIGLPAVASSKHVALQDEGCWCLLRRPHGVWHGAGVGLVCTGSRRHAAAAAAAETLVCWLAATVRSKRWSPCRRILPTGPIIVACSAAARRDHGHRRADEAKPSHGPAGASVHFR